MHGVIAQWGTMPRDLGSISGENAASEFIQGFKTT